MLRRPTDARTGFIAVADCLPSAARIPATSGLSAAILAGAGLHPATTVAAVGAAAPRVTAAAGRRRLPLTDSWGKHAMDVVGLRSGRRRAVLLLPLLLLLALVQLPWRRHPPVPNKKTSARIREQFLEIERCLPISALVVRPRYC